MIAGLIAAVTIAVWFLLFDVFQGRPFFTPNVLGTALFGGKEGLASLENLPISFQVVTFTWVHGLAFVVFGVAAAWLVHLAERDPNYGFGILLLLVVIGFGLISVNLVLAEAIPPPCSARDPGWEPAGGRRDGGILPASASRPDLSPLTRISHHPLGGWIIGCELECFFLSVAFAVEPGPVGGWS